MPLPRRRFLQRSVLSALALLIMGGCEAPDQGAATPVPTPTPADVLELASRRLAETPTVHFVLDIEGDTFIDTGGNIRLLGAEGDLQRPDRVQTTFQAEVMGRTISLQLITIGDQSWTTNVLTGEWGEAPIEFTYRPDILFSSQEGMGPVMGRVEGARRLEDEEIEGNPTFHVQATVEQEVVGPLTYDTIKGSPVTVDLWIDQETHDLLRARLAEPSGPERPNPATWTLDLSHHGEEFSIEPPVEPAPAATPLATPT